jgi:hypothetical protein
MFFGNYPSEHYSKFAHASPTTRAYSFLEVFLSSSPKCVTKLHVAAIVKRGKILASATNQVASRSSGASTRGSQSHIHAEKNVLRHISRSDLRGASMYVMRVKDTPNGPYFQYSQPCPECTVLLKKCMREYGLQNVYFTV